MVCPSQAGLLPLQREQHSLNRKIKKDYCMAYIEQQIAILEGINNLIF